MKIKLVFHTVGRVLLLEAALMLLPLAVSLIYGESCSLSFVISAAAAAVVGRCVLRNRFRLYDNGRIYPHGC